jgi:hypothetical protein
MDIRRTEGRRRENHGVLRSRLFAENSRRMDDALEPFRNYFPID